MCGRAASSKSVAHLQAIVGAAIFPKAAPAAPQKPAPKPAAKPAAKKSGSAAGGKSWATQHFVPAYNKSPGTVLPVLRNLSKEEQSAAPNTPIRVLQPMVWGLIPSYEAVETRRTNMMSNARVETLTELKPFRRLVNKRRCVLAIEGFFEWHKTTNKLGQEKAEPYYITPVENIRLAPSHTAAASATTTSSVAESASTAATETTIDASASAPSARPAEAESGGEPENTSLLYLASLYDVAPPDVEGEEETWSFTVITTEASKDFNWLHDRLPAVLRSAEDVERWLDCDNTPFEAVQSLLRPVSGLLKWHRVTDYVNSVRNQGDECVLPYEIAMARRHSQGLGRFFQTLPASAETTSDTSTSSPSKKHTASTASSSTRDEPLTDAELAACLSAELNAQAPIGEGTCDEGVTGAAATLGVTAGAAGRKRGLAQDSDTCAHASSSGNQHRLDDDLRLAKQIAAQDFAQAITAGTTADTATGASGTPGNSLSADGLIAATKRAAEQQKRRRTGNKAGPSDGASLRPISQFFSRVSVP